MNTKNINPIVYFIIVFFFGGLGVHKFIDGKIGIGILYILTGGIFGIGWLIDIIKSLIQIFSSKNKSYAPVMPQDQNYNTDPIQSQNYTYQNPQTAPVQPKEFGARNIYQFPEKVDDCCLAYHYFITLNEIDVNVLKQIEQDNDFKLTLDEKGYVYYNGTKFASIPNNNIVTMYQDWNRREWPCICELNRASINPLDASLRLGFYRNNNKYYDSKYKKISCRLTACTSDDKQSEIESLEIGSLLEFETEFNDRTGNEDYLVSKIDYIGKLPKKAIEIDDSYGIIAITVADLTEDDNGHTIPILNVYYSN